MHEFGMCRSLIDAATAGLAALPEPRPRVVKVTVEVGRLGGISGDALRHSFALLASGTPLEGATLVVGEAPFRGRCDDCGGEFETDALAFACPACGSGAVRLWAGHEVRVVSFETAEEAPRGG